MVNAVVSSPGEGCSSRREQPLRRLRGKGKHSTRDRSTGVTGDAGGVGASGCEALESHIQELGFYPKGGRPMK